MDYGARYTRFRRFTTIDGAKAFEPEYTAVLARGTALGYTLPSVGQQAKQNALIVALKAAGVWAKLDTFRCFATDGDSNFACLNWKNPLLYQSTKVNAPVFTANKGFAGNGSSSYLSSSFNPFLNGVNYVKDNASATCYMDTVDDTSGALKFFFGAIDASYTCQLAEDNVPGNMRPDVNGNNSGPISAAKIGAHWFSSNRDNSTQVKIFQDSTLTTGSDTSNGVPNANTTLLVRSDLFGYTDRRISMFCMGANLVAENAAFKTAWLNYFTTI